MSLKYEPASEPLHIYVKQLFSNRFWGAERIACSRGARVVLSSHGHAAHPVHLQHFQYNSVLTTLELRNGSNAKPNQSPPQVLGARADRVQPRGEGGWVCLCAKREHLQQYTGILP